MKIVARRGKSTYLVDLGEGQGRVYDESTRTLHPALNLQSILGRGYWEPFPGELKPPPVAKHEGPGPHPGTGTSQDAHGGGAGTGSGSGSVHPATYYHGSGRDTGRALMGEPAWDDLFFVTHDPKIAGAYGKSVRTIRFAADTRILEDGTPAFKKIRRQATRNLKGPDALFKVSLEMTRLAREAGYHVLDFKRDYIGAVVLDESKVVEGGRTRKHQGPGPHQSGTPQSVHGGTTRYLASRTLSRDPGMGGFTFRFVRSPKMPEYGGNMVSAYPEREYVIPTGDFVSKGPALIRDFRDRNSDLLSQPDHYIGGWRDDQPDASPPTDNVFLDVSILVKDHSSARRLARDHDQLAYWDLDRDREVRYDPDADTWREFDNAADAWIPAD